MVWVAQCSPTVLDVHALGYVADGPKESLRVPYVSGYRLGAYKSQRFGSLGCADKKFFFRNLF